MIVSGVGEWRYVDCVSHQGGKLQALEYVRALFNIPRSQCVSAGDSGNDILMLKGAAHGPAMQPRTAPFSSTGAAGHARMQ